MLFFVSVVLISCLRAPCFNSGLKMSKEAQKHCCGPYNIVPLCDVSLIVTRIDPFEGTILFIMAPVFVVLVTIVTLS